MNIKNIAKNRKASFEYFLLEHFEAGIALHGTEIKSVRAGHVSISEAYVQLDGQEAWLINSHIAPYEPGSRNNHEPKRPRKLLLHKKEIKKIWNEVRQKGVTVIPTQFYIKDNLAKVDIAIAKGKKLYDKRDDMAKKDQEREIQRRERNY